MWSIHWKIMGKPIGKPPGNMRNHWKTILIRWIPKNGMTIPHRSFKNPWHIVIAIADGSMIQPGKLTVCEPEHGHGNEVTFPMKNCDFFIVI